MPASRAAFGRAAAPVEDDMMNDPEETGVSAAEPEAALAPISPQPPMPEPIVDWLKAQLQGSRCFLEFGAGASTRLAASLNVPEIVSVESDLAFGRSVARAVKRSPSSSHHQMVLVDLGPTKDWGFPRYYRALRRWPEYSLRIWEHLRQEKLSPDLVLVDGRFRVACFLAALAYARAGTHILFDDYTTRPEKYAIVERHLAYDRLIDRAAVFTVPEREALNPVEIHEDIAIYMGIPY